MDDFYPIRLLRTHAYALVDREALGGEVPPDWPLIPLVPRGLESDAQRLPALLPLEEMAEAQRMDLLETLDNPLADDPLPVVTLLDSDIDLEQMRVHWVNRLIVHLPGGQQALLRSYDPRVFAQLQWMSSPAQLAALFGPIRRWTIWLDGRWQSIRPPAHDGLPGGAISAEQAALLARIGQINEVLFSLPEQQRHPHEKASRAIDALLVRAQANGLRREDDQRTFALRGMTVHPHFDRDPQVQTLLQNMADAEHTLAYAFAGLGDAYWRQIAEYASQHSQSLNGKQA